MSLYVPEKLLPEAKEALRRAAMKIPLGTSIEINKIS